MIEGQSAWTIYANSSRTRGLLIALILSLVLGIAFLVDKIDYDNDVNEEGPPIGTRYCG